MPTTLELLATLVGFATESRTPNTELLAFVVHRVEELGGRTEYVPGPEGRANLLASFGPESVGGLLLSAHTDVVASGTGWATPPYVLTQLNDRLHGRGTADMKGFIACVLAALPTVGLSSLTLPLHLAFSFDEEIGCAGMPTMLERLAISTSVRPDLVVVGEPTLMRPRHRHAGKIAYELTLLGTAGHSSRSPEQPSTITSAARIAIALDELQDSYRSRDVGATHEVTVNCGVIHGGSALNVIAERCELSFELRHAPELKPDDLLRPIFTVIEHERHHLSAVGGGIVVTEVTRYPGLAADPTHPLIALVERLADTGRCVPIGYGTEGGLYAEALQVPVVICGPGDIAVAHRSDEYVTTQQLNACEGFLQNLIQALCLTGD